MAGIVDSQAVRAGLSARSWTETIGYAPVEVSIGHLVCLSWFLTALGIKEGIDDSMFVVTSTLDFGLKADRSL